MLNFYFKSRFSVKLLNSEYISHIIVVLVTPDEIFDYFIDVKLDLIMEADLYIELSQRATV